jgi:MFS family permease
VAVDPVGWRAAFWVCVVPLLFAPVLARFLPESLSFLLAKGRTDEARELAARYDVELPAATSDKPGAADRWTNSRPWSSSASPRCAATGGRRRAPSGNSSAPTER